MWSIAKYMVAYKYKLYKEMQLELKFKCMAYWIDSLLLLLLLLLLFIAGLL